MRPFDKLKAGSGAPGSEAPGKPRVLRLRCSQKAAKSFALDSNSKSQALRDAIRFRWDGYELEMVEKTRQEGGASDGVEVRAMKDESERLEFDPEQSADEKSFENCCDTWWDRWWLLLVIVLGVLFVAMLDSFHPVG